jgi:hypothetical protein
MFAAGEAAGTRIQESGKQCGAPALILDPSPEGRRKLDVPLSLRERG